MKPGPVLVKVFRAPVWLYEHRLGWLLGDRFLCLTHVGRKSGRRYRTVLEVIATRPGGEFEVVVGRRAFRPAYRVLDESEATAVMSGYERRNR